MPRVAHAALVALCLAATVTSAQQPDVSIPSRIYVHGSEPAFLHLTNVFITWRRDEEISAMFDVGSMYDSSGQLLYFNWWDSHTPALGETARVTNSYTFGRHRVYANIWNGPSVSAYSEFDVISPLQAIRLLRADLEISGFRMDVAKWRGQLQTAEAAIKRHHWGTASRALARFKSKLEDVNPGDVDGLHSVEGWRHAASHIRYALQARGPSPANPGGVFPISTGGVWTTITVFGYHAVVP